MQDEQMDDMIRDAADKHLPTYNDSAWPKMKDLLDKHLPEKKDRKRPVAWLVLLLIVAAAGTVLTVKMLQKNEAPATATAPISNKDNNIAKIPSDNSPSNNNAPTPKTNTITSNVPVNNGLNVLPIDSKPANLSIVDREQNNATNNSHEPLSPNSRNSRNTRVSNKTASKGIIKTTGLAANEENPVVILPAVIPEPDDNPLNIDKPATNKVSTAVATTSTEKEKTVSADAKKEEAKQPEQKTTTTASVKKKKTKANPLEKIGISLSAGGELSYATLHNFGEGKSLLGAGLHYDINDRISIGTGFYSSRKIYSASRYQYHSPADINQPSYSNLERVDANCLVYEIPVSMKYSFPSKKNNKFYAGVGVSSMLMKEENYTYNYKTVTGQYYTSNKTFNNNSKHFMSTLGISLGYQLNVSKKLSFSAEPYLKLPISGIGYGKVKLNSAGLMFNATLKPFAKKNK